MLPRERVIATIRHQKADRIPVYGWIKANLGVQLTAAFGSAEAFEDKYEFDYAHLFGGPQPYDYGYFEKLLPDGIEPAALMDIPLPDPDDMSKYESIRKDVAFHKGQRGRFVYMQTPGIFECLNGAFGIENHLAWLAMYEEDLHRVYLRQAEWNRAFAMNCLDLGVDMVHVSDDWGSQNNLMFSPETWWKLIYPYHKVTADAVKQRGAFLSLHSDGNVLSVVDGIIKLGYDVIHPWQESAGMDLELFKSRYRSSFTIMGGLDVQTTIGFGKIDFLKSEIRRVLSMFRDGGLLYCTSHFVQDHCTVDELTTAYDTVRSVVRELSGAGGKKG